jgi:hypothetical protein
VVPLTFACADCGFTSRELFAGAPSNQGGSNRAVTVRVKQTSGYDPKFPCAAAMIPSSSLSSAPSFPLKGDPARERIRGRAMQIPGGVLWLPATTQGLVDLDQCNQLVRLSLRQS